MRESTARMLPHAQRLLLLALGLGLLWTAAAFFLHIPAAGAAEDDDGGLLGTATSVVEGATGAVDEVAETTLDTAATVVAPVMETVTEPIAKQAPAPVADVVEAVPEVVTPVVESVKQTVTATTEVVDTGTGAVTGTVETVVNSGPVSGVTSPVVDLVSEVPIVGEVAEGVGLAGAITDTTTAIDTTVGTVVVGDAVAPPAPPLVVTIPDLEAPVVPAPAVPVSELITVGTATAEASTVAAMVSVAAAMTAAWWAQDGSWAPSAIATAMGAAAVAGAAATRLLTSPAAPSGAPVSAGGNGGVASASGAQPITGMLGDTWRSLLLAGPPRTLVDDALPGAPIYATDSTPD